MTKRAAVLLLAGLLTSAIPSAANAQQDPTGTAQAQEPLRVFLDCERNICDPDHFRREVDFVSYVRDRTEAELHVLVTSQDTGSGGEEYTF